MGGYFRLKKLIDSYSNKEDINFTSDTISAYDLCILLDSKFSDLKSAVDCSKIENILNTSLKKTNKNFHVECSTTVRFQNEQKVLLFINLYYKNKKVLYYCCEKDINDNQIGLHDYDNEGIKYIKVLENAIFSNEHEICKHLSLFDNLIDLYKANSEEYHSPYEKLLTNPEFIHSTEMVSDDLFTIYFHYNINGYLSYQISINKEQDINNTYNHFYYNLTPLYEIVKQNEGEILKKIPVSINYLNPMFRCVINESKKQTDPVLCKRYLNN